MAVPLRPYPFSLTPPPVLLGDNPPPPLIPHPTPRTKEKVVQGFKGRGGGSSF